MADKTADQLELESKGYYKLSLVKQIGYGAGDMAQNFIYQNVSGFINYYYSDVYKIGQDPAKSATLSATLMLVVRIIDVIWDPIVGAFVDKSHPKFGKYRSWLLYAGLPLCIIAILCYWNGFQNSAKWLNIGYAFVTYTLLQMCYTLTNVPYGALNASLTRDPNEIDKLTTTRMAMANIAGLFVWTGFPIVIALLAKEHVDWNVVLFNFIGAIPGIFLMPLVPSIRKAIGKKNVFYLFGAIGIVGYLSLYFINRFNLTIKKGDSNDVVMLIANFIKSTGLSVTTGYMWAIVPEVITYAEYTTGRRIAGIVNALTGIFFKAGFALGGALPGWIAGGICGYNPEKSTGGGSYSTNANAWFLAMIIYGVVGLVLLLFCFVESKEKVVMDEKETKNVKFTDLFVEFARNGPLRIIALYFITAFCCMNVHNTAVGWFFKLDGQTALAKEGVRWCIAVIPAILMGLMIVIMFFYSLTDDKMEEINKEIELRARKNEEVA